MDREPFLNVDEHSFAKDGWFISIIHVIPTANGMASRQASDRMDEWIILWIVDEQSRLFIKAHASDNLEIRCERRGEPGIAGGGGVISKTPRVGQLGRLLKGNLAASKISIYCIAFTTAPLLWSGRTGSKLQMNRLSLRINRLKFKTAGNLPTILEEFIEYTPIQWRKPRWCQHVTGWTCKH